MPEAPRIWMTSAIVAAVAALTAVVCGAQAAEAPSVAVDPMECVPVGGNGVVTATVSGNLPETTVRLYFRRLHDVVEDLYFVTMHAEGDGRFWGVMPKAEKRRLNRHEIEEERAEAGYQQAEWWRIKERSDHRNPNRDLDDDEIRERASLGKAEDRSWMSVMTDDEFESWLNRLEYEPVEYFVAVVAADGEVLAKSPMQAGEVRSADRCEVELTPEQAGEAANLIVGETAPWQQNKPVFHWLCAGVIARVDPSGVKRADAACRQCVPCFDQNTILDYTIGGAVSPSSFD